MTGKQLDVRGMACSDAVVSVHRALMPLPAGSSVTVTTDDPEVLIDLRRYAQRSGHRWGRERPGPNGITEVEVVRSG